MSDAVEVVESVASSIGSSTVSSVGSAVIVYIVMALAAVAAGIAFWIWSLVSQIDNLTLVVNEQKALVALKEAQINGFVAAVDHQNEAIEKMRVDTLQASKDLAATSKVIENRYSTVTVADKTCEGKVKAYEDMLKVFFSRK